jgi:hypothetical protein
MTAKGEVWRRRRHSALAVITIRTAGLYAAILIP